MTVRQQYAGQYRFSGPIFEVTACRQAELMCEAIGGERVLCQKEYQFQFLVKGASRGPKDGVEDIQSLLKEAADNLAPKWKLPYKIIDYRKRNY